MQPNDPGLLNYLRFNKLAAKSIRETGKLDIQEIMK